MSPRSMPEKQNKNQLGLLDPSAARPGPGPGAGPGSALARPAGTPFPGLLEALSALRDGDLWLVCRGRATARAVLLALLQSAEGAAWAGLRVTTLSALLA